MYIVSENQSHFMVAILFLPNLHSLKEITVRSPKKHFCEILLKWVWTAISDLKVSKFFLAVATSVLRIWKRTNQGTYCEVCLIWARWLRRMISFYGKGWRWMYDSQSTITTAHPWALHTQVRLKLGSKSNVRTYYEVNFLFLLFSCRRLQIKFNKCKIQLILNIVITVYSRQ